MIKKSLKYKYLIVLLILITSGLCLYFFLLPPGDVKDDLQIMKLKADASPLFKLESQLSYSGDLVSVLQIQLPNDTTTLNLSYIVTNEEIQLSTLIEDLRVMSGLAPKITLSFIPEPIVNEQNYLRLCHELSSLLEQHHLSNVELILFPRDLAVFQGYEKLDTTLSIGISLNGTKDFDTLKPIYEAFSDSKKIFIRENVIASCKENLRLATEEINEIYYTLALQFPKCQTIFSPIIKPSFAIQDSFTLTADNSNYNTYQNIYGRLLQEPWLTLKDVPVASSSPYVSLNSYDTLTGVEEIIISPDATLLTQSEYIHYRLEEQDFTVQSYYPYVLKLDTTLQANGVTRFKALGYNATGEVFKVQSIDLTIANENVPSRAVRSLESYPLSNTMKYATDYIPILMYHTISDVVAPEDERSCVTTTLFDAQMKALLDNGYTPINFKVLHNYLNGISGLPDKPILITMDDGYLNNYTNAYPIYKKYNISATLFVSSYFMKDENTERHFGWDAAREMEASGLIDIQSHGYNHTPLSYLSLKDVRYHISHSKGLIEKNLGKRDVFVVAYPQFRNSRYTRKLLSEMGVDFQLTKLADMGTGLNPISLKRINVPNTMSPGDLIATLQKFIK